MRFFGGIYGLYNVATGYLSDILSYSRLLALGLATGCIAQVINLIGAMPSNAVAEGILLFILFPDGPHGQYRHKPFWAHMSIPTDFSL